MQLYKLCNYKMAAKFEIWQFDITFTGRGSWRVQYTTRRGDCWIAKHLTDAGVIDDYKHHDRYELPTQASMRRLASAVRLYGKHYSKTGEEL